MTTITPANPAQPEAGVVLCRLADLADPSSRGFRFKTDAAMFAGFVVLKDGALRGYVDSCPHYGWPMARPDGNYLTKESDLIICMGHGALFRIDDGACAAGPGGGPLRPWPVQVVDGAVVTA
jgi:nitrite reductase/ring-hydroxylating ferredoxin subunit